MQFSTLLMALAASSVSAVTINNAVADASSNNNVNSTVGDVSAIANAGNTINAPADTSDDGSEGGHGGYPDHPGYPGCTTTSTHGQTYTITDLTVSTYCPVCDDAKDNGDVYTTTCKLLLTDYLFNINLRS